MLKMRVLVAADRGRRAPIARALGLATARPGAEVSSAADRASLLRELFTRRWNVLLIESEFDGAPADQLLAAASHLLHDVSVFILTGTGDAATVGRCIEAGAAGAIRPDQLGDLTRMLERSTERRTERPPAGVPLCDSLDELFAADGRRPRHGLMSSLLLERGARPTEQDARRVVELAGSGCAVCLWQSSHILVLRRAPAAGAALVHAHDVVAALGEEWSAGLTWAAAHELHDDTVNQSEHALRLAQAREDGVCTWKMVVAQRTAQSVAARGGDSKREGFLSRFHASLGPVQREHLASHSDEVAEASQRMAQLMRLSNEETEEARLAGLLHDLGKSVIPDDLLAKPGALTPSERRVMDRHAREGQHLCDALGLDPAIGRIVLNHHARFDSGTDIPRAARIVCVADALVTMTSTRPYSTARSYSEALTELRRCRGTMFDPKVVVAAHILGASSMAAAA